MTCGVPNFRVAGLGVGVAAGARGEVGAGGLAGSGALVGAAGVADVAHAARAIISAKNTENLVPFLTPVNTFSLLTVCPASGRRIQRKIGPLCRRRASSRCRDPSPRTLYIGPPCSSGRAFRWGPDRSSP